MLKLLVYGKMNGLIVKKCLKCSRMPESHSNQAAERMHGMDGAAVPTLASGGVEGPRTIEGVVAPPIPDPLTYGEE